MKFVTTGAVAILLFGCGVPKEFVRQETTTAFNNAGMAARRIQDKCQEQDDQGCESAKKSLSAICQGLDELSIRADGHGFDCANWKAKP